MMLETHQVGVEGSHCLRRGASFAFARTALSQHCADVVAPVVLISGVYGTERAGLISYTAPRGWAAVELVASREIPGAPLARRLEILDTVGGTAHEAARSLLTHPVADPDLERTFVFPHADLLDEESLMVVDEVVRTQQIVVLLSSMAPSRLALRFARVLNSPRGLHLELAPLSLEETHHRLAQQLEEPPTAALTRYLHTCSDGAPESLMRLARRGLAEGWIASVDARSVVLGSPSWMDHLEAQASLDRLRTRVGGVVVDVLRALALRGEMPLDEAMSVFQPRDAIFALEESGLLTIRPEGVSIRRESHRQALIMAREPVSDPPSTPEGVLHARSVGAEITSEAARRTGWALLERGLLEQARFVVEVLPTQDASRGALEACCDLVAGAPRRALRQLVPIAAAGDLTAAALIAFIHGTVLEDTVAGAQSLSNLSAMAGEAPEVQDLIEALRQIHRSLREDMDHNTVPEEHVQPAARTEVTSPCRTPATSGIDLAGLGRVLLQVLEAFSVASGQAPSAPVRVAKISEISFREVPIVCVSWAISCLAAARLLTVPQEDILPERWFRDEPPGRSLLRVNATEALEMLHAMMSGEGIDDLRRRMEDLWAQYEGGLPQGFLRRPLLEALDFAVEGGRTEDLLGPTGFIPRKTGSITEASWAHVLTAVGRVLGLAARGDVSQVDVARELAPACLVMRRLVIRCVVLRGIHDLDDAALVVLEVQGRAVGVEEEILDLLTARLTGDGPRFAVAAEAVEAHWPRSGLGRSIRGRFRGLRRAAAIPATTGEQLAMLSAREQEVAEQVLQGLSLAEIADSLRISIRTVQSHVRNTYRKLDVRSRTELRARLVDTSLDLR
ncbi:helix-turn-helix transcriptional regulator [Nesterenkonia sp. HG001]|uniref:helix-turn-helix transcriptional regulator n=1 Tax=Nesterenkonia sp. HG001 TaxID=2983207 RepID=UPI002AC4C818|nr:helix-turn-helix transcriptional regulator [Nesterenkonia sp. HG001]MDZ5077449.1 helix-turn-helix transcriptional regulator [Nesterenkonia sp. HG001]